MVLSSAKDLGRTIASQQKQIDELKQNVKPNDPNATFPLFTTERVTVTKTLEVYKKRMTGVYIVGHPTYGVIGGESSFSMPITMPLTLETIGYPVGPLCILGNEAWAILNDCILGDRDTDQYERTLLYSTTI